MALHFTDKSIKDYLNSGKLVVVDFWAEWYGPCRMIGPIIEEVAAEYDGRAFIGKLNVDENDEFVSANGIRNIPTILFFKNGEAVDKQVGAVSKAILKEKIDKWV